MGFRRVEAVALEACTKRRLVKTVQINKFFFQLGGVERRMSELSKLLLSSGHDVPTRGAPQPLPG